MWRDHLHGVGPSRPWGFGLLVWESSLYPCSCCLSRCQNAVLLQDLNFWKLIKTCLLWGGQGPLDVDPPSVWRPSPSLLSARDWVWQGARNGMEEGAALLLLCPLLELISVKSPANLLLLPLPICWLLFPPQHQLRGILGETAFWK